MMIGFPGSGKTTVRNKLIKTKLKNNKDLPLLVCPDEIRASMLYSSITGVFFDHSIECIIWEIVPQILKEIIKQEKDIIYDATNLSLYNRKSIIEIFKETKYEIIGIYINTSIEECKKRNEKRKAKVSDEVYTKMSNIFIEPSIDEGFKKIIIK